MGPRRRLSRLVRPRAAADAYTAGGSAPRGGPGPRSEGAGRRGAGRVDAEVELVGVEGGGGGAGGGGGGGAVAGVGVHGGGRPASEICEEEGEPMGVVGFVLPSLFFVCFFFLFFGASSIRAWGGEKEKEAAGGCHYGLVGRYVPRSLSCRAGWTFFSNHA